jgi:hypothetical protein
MTEAIFNDRHELIDSLLKNHFSLSIYLTPERLLNFYQAVCLI